ncbi:MAG: hypothetical protein N3E50_03900, partial [Candidatus Goldbacteria bacterium]|nr:hypothetical protein [Candidatus Goldiibacteriota bacterium]
MNKLSVLFLMFFLIKSIIFSYEYNFNKYKFEVYYLIKGQMKKNKERPNFGWRILKTFPLSVKEYTFTSQYYDYNSTEITELANKINENLKESRQKNAIHIADEIFRYIQNNISDREIIKEIKDNPHKIFFSYRQVLKEQKACDVEKCRLAITLFRYFTIPARMVYINNHYAVEYFIMPLKGKGDWYLMDFYNNENIESENTIPVYWHPLDCRELLNEMWTNNCYVNMLEVKDILLNPDEQEA